MKILSHTVPNEKLAWSRIASSLPDQSQPLRCAESGAASWPSILPVSTVVASSDMCLKKYSRCSRHGVGTYGSRVYHKGSNIWDLD
jgi:hypothetical protein